MYKIVFFVPELHKEAVKQAMFDAGAGRYKGYDFCSWETLGSGQFRPLEGSQPFIGEQGTIEHVAEFRVEIICSASIIKVVLQALLKSHPYETPAYDVCPIKTLEDF